MKNSKSTVAKLSVCNLGVALGIVWGLSTLLITYLNMFYMVGDGAVEIFNALYLGYEATLIGGLIGFAWGFVHGLVSGALIAVIYNLCSCCCPCPSCKSTRCGDTKTSKK